MTFHDLLWHSIAFHSLLLHIFHCFPECSVRFHYLPSPSRMFHDVPWGSMTFPWVLWPGMGICEDVEMFWWCICVGEDEGMSWMVDIGCFRDVDVFWEMWCGGISGCTALGEGYDLWVTLLGWVCVSGGIGVHRRVMNGSIGGMGGVRRMVCVVIGVGYRDMLGHCWAGVGVDREVIYI